MNIQQTPTFCNPFFNLTLGTSNLTPSIWYHKILHKNGKPDNVGITILSELFHLYLSSELKERELQPGCAYLQNKFNYTYDQVYEALLKLDSLRLINKKGKCITLNVENVLALSTEQKDTDNNSDTPKKTDFFTDKNNKDTSLNIDLYIDILERDIEDKREENYISDSRFDEKESDAVNKNITQTKNNSINSPAHKSAGIMRTSLVLNTAKKWVKKNFTRQPIASFHPLTEEDADALRLSSGREFNLNFINQLILRLGTKYPNHSFYTKKIFLKYMATLLANEMRQAVNVNNEGFRFKRTDDEGVAEEYLARVEDGYGTCASNQIRKKVAASFEPTVAYKILTSYYFPEEVYEGRYEIKQRSSFELSESQRDRLYSQISAVFGDRVRNIQITKNFKHVAKLPQITTPAISLDTATLWGRVRSGLIASYGEAIDKSWFSRLETTEDTSSRSLILKGASFLTDYIQTNYSHVIERLCREENYQLKFC